jgi:2-polyprenyl-3-methyl-5-hydroxy-6-metoxy-1,4-benzoquinol methylase
MKSDPIRKQWDDVAKGWIDFVRTGKDHYRDFVNNPAVFKVLGDVKRKRILDLACGEGYNARIMARKGARVTGVDFSSRMLSAAGQSERRDKLGIAYVKADARDLSCFRQGSFDLVVCIMGLMDIEDHQRAIRAVLAVLKQSGRFIISIPHPCFERRFIDGEIVGGWEFKKGSADRSTENALFWKVDRYFQTGRYTVNWDMDRLRTYFKTLSFHRTLTDYSDALTQNGFVISRLMEPEPTPNGMKKIPGLKKLLRVPASIVIEAVRK